MRVFKRPPCLLLLTLFVPILSGCPSRTPANPAQTPAANPLTNPTDRSAGAFAQTDPWLLTTTDPNAGRGNHGVFIGNGSIGVGVGSSGLPEKTLFMAGQYDDKENLKNFGSYLSFIRPAPAKSDASYSQALDMKRGVLTTKTAAGTATVFASAVWPGLLVVHETGELGQTVTPESQTPQTTGEGKLAHVSRKEADGSVTEFIAPLGPGQKTEAVLPKSLSFANLLAGQETAWQTLWQTADIQIDGDPEAQQLVHKLMFDLLQSTRPGMSDSIAPESLSGDFYKGHIFWDAEIWMFPALLAQHPDYARAILDYRFKHLPEARAIAKQDGYKGADFPWESAASGKEVAPNGFSIERHVTAGVGWAAWQYYLATGDKAWLKERGWPLISSVADYWASRAKKNAQTGKYDVNGVLGPDELNKSVDNNTYTNALAANVLRYAGDAAKIVGQKTNPQWAVVAQNIALPFDKANNRYLTYQSDKGAKTKQADGELLFYPVDLAMDKKIADATWEYQKGRPIKNGPAMTDSVHALIAARLGRKDEAETYFRESYRPFMRGPFLLFSEKRSLDRCVFTTGAGGVLQSVLYGFGGLDFSKPDGLIQTPPVLPKSWKKLTITGIQRGGKRYTLTVTPEKRTLTPEK